MDKTVKLIYWQRITLGVLLFSLCATILCARRQIARIESQRQRPPDLRRADNSKLIEQIYSYEARLQKAQDQHERDRKLIDDMKSQLLQYKGEGFHTFPEDNWNPKTGEWMIMDN